MSFLQLPGEIRNRIYEEFLEDLVSDNHDLPCTISTVHAKSRDYLHFILTGRQVYWELSTTFAARYSSRMTVSIPSVMQLLHLTKSLSYKSPIFNAKFTLSAQQGSPEEQRRISGLGPQWACDTASLLQRLPGFRSAWLQQPGLYNTEPEQWDAVDKEMMCALGIPDYEFEPWTPESEGFELTYGDCSHDSSVKTSHAYKKLVWPALRDSCRLTTFTWTDKAAQQKSTMILEGRLKDLCVY